MVLNDVAIFTHFERKRERGMTKWIDQSVLDATINRRRYFPLFRHFASRFDPTRTRFALSRVSPFIFSLTVIIPPTLCSGHQRARRFSFRTQSESGRTHRMRGRWRSLQRRIKLQPVRGLKPEEKKKRIAFATQKGTLANPPLIGPLYIRVDSAVLLFPFPPLSLLSALVTRFSSSRSSFSFAISFDSLTARALRYELTSYP